MRVNACAALERGAADKIATVHGDPDTLLRRLLSGYVPVEDTEGVLEFLGHVSKGMQQVVHNANSPSLGVAGLNFTAGQVLVLGVLLGRAEGR